MSFFNPVERENLKLIGFCVFFQFILHADLIAYESLFSLNYYGWIFSLIGYVMNLFSKFRLPVYGVIHQSGGPLHWLLRTTVSLFICLVLNSEFDPFVQFLLFLFAELCLFVKVTVVHHDHGGREILVDIL
jgi:hypothetical protein